MNTCIVVYAKKYYSALKMNELSKLEMTWLMLKAFNGEKENANLKITLYDCNHIALMKGKNHQ